MTSRTTRSVAGAAYRLLAAALLAWTLAPPPSAAAQKAPGWTFEDDAFADLWFHGLAVVGFYGFGPFPLYDPEYAAAVRRQDRDAGSPPTALERDRRDLLTSFQSSDLFEVLHFIPLYFHGAGRREGSAALRAITDPSRGSPEASPATRFGVSVVSQLIPEDRERRTLGRFVEDLDEEWDSVVGPRRADDREARALRLQAVQSVWDTSWAPALAGFLETEGFATGTVLVVPALGAEGRFLDRDPGGAPGPLVALGMPDHDEAAPAVLSSLVRELCYPMVRRVFASFEARFSNRIEASRASDLTATRCGELLLERRAPAQVPAYRARFGLPSTGMGRAFLSAFGQVPGAAAWEGELEDALLRELDHVPNSARPLPPPVRRRR